MEKLNYVILKKGDTKGEFYESLRSMADAIKVNHSTISKKLSNDTHKCVITSKQLKQEFYIFKLV